MELYTRVAYGLSRQLTNTYSSSFGLASKLYARNLRPHVYAIYGMVRVADEIVDTYDGSDRSEQLTSFRDEVIASLTTNYSPNPIVHAFATTAREFSIDASLIDPFFDSMAMDLKSTVFTQAEYETYIYGSAEVVGLMCLKVFCGNDVDRYDALAPGARLLGSAYQKVNFLRDIAADYESRGRVYFPDVTYERFDDRSKQAIIDDISREFTDARASISQLPVSARRAVLTSYRYYHALLTKLTRMSASQIKHNRAHVSGAYKFWVFVRGVIAS